MKKIITSVGMIVFVAALIAGGTGAFFSDTETSTGNVFTAGSIDLSLGSTFSSDANGSGQVALQPDNNGGILFTFNDLKPGDDGTVIFELQVDSNEAYACAISTLMTNNDNGINDPESDAGDLDDGAGNGELQDYLQFATFVDSNGDNAYNAGEPINVNQYGAGDNNGFTNAEVAAAGWVPVADTTFPNTWLVEDALTPATPYGAGMLYCFGDFTITGDDDTAVVTGCDGGAMGEFNDAQTDSATGGITFSAVQTRNNENFTCAAQNVVEEPAWVESAQTGGDAVEDGGLLTLTTINDVNSRVRYTNMTVPADLDLEAISGFTYDSRQVSAADAVNGNASFRLIVDLLDDGSLIKDVTFEPYYNIAAHNSLNDASILPNTWQTWEANQTDGKFWASGVTTVNGLSGGGGAYATNFSLAELSAAYPNAKVLGISVGMGTYNVNQVVEVDNLDFNSGMITGF